MNNTTTEWEPKYEDWEEDKVEMSDSCASTNSSSHGEYGVMLQQPEYPYRGNGAIFWIDPQHIYFRYDWGLWFPVSNDDAENCSIICKRRTGTLYLCSMTNLKHIPVKIYHIDRLPEELFGKPEEKKTEESQNTRPLDSFVPVDIEEAAADSADVSEESHPFMPWEIVRETLEDEFKGIGINVFPNVSMGEGYAHYAFSTENRAVVMQPYLGKGKLIRQCKQLRKLREQLLENEPNCHVMAALYFSSDAERMSRIKGIARITPSNLTSFRKFLKPDKRK